MPVDDKAKGLNKFHGVTDGTVTADKVVVVDSNKDIGSFRNLTITGTLSSGAISITGGTGSGIKDLAPSNKTAVNGGTSSTATANAMSGVVRIPNMTTEPGNTHICTIFNSIITPGTTVQVTQAYSGSGIPLVISVDPFVGAFTVTIRNIDATSALNSIFSIYYLVIQQ